MVWGRRREEGSGWGTHVYLWCIHVDIWQNQYNIVKLKNKIKKEERKKKKKDLNVRPETIKLLEENIGKTFSDINLSRILYDPPPRILEIKAKINK